jgi:hypothetical protein
VAPVAAAGPLTMVAALSRPEIKPPGSAGELSLQLRHVATREMSGSDYFQTSASLSVVALCCCMGHSSPARATPGPVCDGDHWLLDAALTRLLRKGSIRIFTRNHLPACRNREVNTFR